LSHFADAWQSITSDPVVLNIVTEGVKLFFYEQPPLTATPRFTGIPKLLSNREKLAFEIEQLVQKNAVTVIAPGSWGFYSTVFIIPKKDGGHA
jgi:hypothetical protein